MHDLSAHFIESPAKNQKSSRVNIKFTIHYPHRLVHDFVICFLISYISCPFVIVGVIRINVSILFYSILLEGPKDEKIKENAKFFHSKVFKQGSLH